MLFKLSLVLASVGMAGVIVAAAEIPSIGTAIAQSPSETAVAVTIISALAAMLKNQSTGLRNQATAKANREDFMSEYRNFLLRFEEHVKADAVSQANLGRWIGGMDAKMDHSAQAIRDLHQVVESRK